MNADPRVMEHFPARLSRAESDALVDWAEAHYEEHGFGPWAVEIPGVAEFAGFTGLSIPNFTASFTPCVEVGWRFAAEFWGKGYATEAAMAALQMGFEEFGMEEIVSFTFEGNTKSRNVMDRIGMTRDTTGDFLHPKISAGHRLLPHVLYRIRRDDFLNSKKESPVSRPEGA